MYKILIYTFSIYTSIYLCVHIKQEFNIRIDYECAVIANFNIMHF